MKGWLSNSVLRFMLAVVVFAGAVSAQSTDQNYPSPITASELIGTIQPRDIGDARLTTYYYIFDAGQGDLFINFLTKNFSGDIDIFVQEGLRPLSKIVMYADLAETETGRVLYLRKAERLMMRVQGRTPGDDPATFRIKFAGSFHAIADGRVPEQPVDPKVTSSTDTNVRVNSVGTILEVIPKAVPAKEEKVEDDVAAVKKEDEVETKPAEKSITEIEEPTKKVEVVISDNTPTLKVEEPAAATPARRRRGSSASPRSTRERVTAKAPPPARRTPPAKVATPPAEPASDPLANVQLVIEFKDGRTIKRPMTDVFRFTFDRGQLTVISKDGSIGRYPMLDVASVTIK